MFIVFGRDISLVLWAREISLPSKTIHIISYIIPHNLPNPQPIYISISSQSIVILFSHFMYYFLTSCTPTHTKLLLKTSFHVLLTFIYFCYLFYSLAFVSWLLLVSLDIDPIIFVLDLHVFGIPLHSWWRFGTPYGLWDFFTSKCFSFMDTSCIFRGDLSTCHPRTSLLTVYQQTMVFNWLISNTYITVTYVGLISSVCLLKQCFCASLCTCILFLKFDSSFNKR